MALLTEQPPKIRLQWFLQVDHTLKQEELRTTLICLSLKLKIDAKIFSGDKQKKKREKQREEAIV